MDEISYRAFEMLIRAPSSEGVYPVSIHIADGNQREEGTFTSPYSETEIGRALQWMEQGLFDTEFAKDFGTRLFHALFNGPIKTLYDSSQQANDGRRLRIRLICNDAALGRIPWELLYDPERELFLAAAGPFVRDISTSKPSRPLTVELPLRILVIDAFPEGVARVQGQAEVAEIQQALRPLIRRRLVDVQTLSHVTLDNLQAALRDAANPAHSRPFHILHFIGHGQYDQTTGRVVLLFEDDQGQIDEVDATALVSVLASYDIKLVFLNACQSLQTSALDIMQGFAPALLNNGVPAVIGMQVTVLDKLARQISRVFYSALADSQPIDQALADVRQLLRGTRARRKADLGIPVGYLRTESGLIFDVRPAPLVRLTRQTVRLWLYQQFSLHRLWAVTISTIGLLSTLLGLIQGVPLMLDLVRGPTPMGGSYNIAVAEFGLIDAQGRVTRSTYAHNLATTVRKQLEGELAALRSDIPVRGPDQIGPITGSTREARAEQAATIAAKHGADIVVYGNLRIDDDQSSFVPEFYLAQSKLSDAEELAGQYEFGTPLFDQGNILNNGAVRDRFLIQLRGRTSALTQFIIGLNNYLTFTPDRFEQATKYFTAAEQSPDWADEDGKEVLYLFLGIVASKRDDLDAAQRYYADALELQPEYARAQLGAAEMTFQKARRGTCAPENVDPVGLQTAVDAFKKVPQAKIKPPFSDIETKTALFLGRVYVCISQTQITDHWSDAESLFQQVIDAYKHGDSQTQHRLQDRAADAYSNQALIYLLRDPSDAATFTRAADTFNQAIDLSRYPDRKALYFVWHAHISLLLGNCVPAQRDLAAARQTYPQEQYWSKNYQAFQAQVQDEWTQVCATQ